MRRPIALLLTSAIAVAVLLVLVLGRSGGGTAGPVQAAEGYQRAVFAGDCAGVKDVVAAPEQVDCVTVAEGAQSLDGIDVDALDYELTESAAGSATVRVTIGDETQDLSLVRTAGRWLVVQDTGA